jgi:hypothetical protein
MRRRRPGFPRARRGRLAVVPLRLSVGTAAIHARRFESAGLDLGAKPAARRLRRFRNFRRCAKKGSRRQASKASSKLRGAGVARGDLGNAEPTAEKFIPDPFGCGQQPLSHRGPRAIPGGRKARVPRARRRAKIRGHRITSKSPRSRSSSPGFPAFATRSRGPHDDSASPQLVAYVVGASGVDSRAAKDVFRRAAPQYNGSAFRRPGKQATAAAIGGRASTARGFVSRGSRSES